jgi:acetoin utilization deacetylase AcuC-like enzyme
MAKPSLIFDPAVAQHQTGPGHPEQPGRVNAVLDHLKQTGTLSLLEQITPKSATDDDLALTHDRGYIEIAKRDVALRRGQLSTGDTSISPASLTVARLAAGSVLTAVDTVVGQKSPSSAFCLVRPPGHHAETRRGMGFCLFNNIAVGARYAQQRYGVERVLIVDWDVHHGNGTQEIFYRDDSVFFFSTHQSPWYPGTGAADETGAGQGEGTTLNCPFAAGAGHSQILGVFRSLLVPAMQEWKPDLVMISTGFDSRLGDPLGRFTLDDGDFVELTQLLLELAGRSSCGALVSVLEGGYSLEGLAAAAEAHIRTLAG